MAKLMEPIYSGPNSVKFWDFVNGIKDKKKQCAAYIMGCNLQDVENRTLRYIRDAANTKRRGK